MKSLRLVLALALFPAAVSLHSAEKSALRAGAAAVDITPKVFPLNMPGGFSANMAESAHDPLHARAMVLADGTTTLTMVVVDNLGAGSDVLDEAKAIASKQTGIPVEKMLISSTHSHTAGALNTRTEPAAAYRRPRGVRHPVRDVRRDGARF